MKAQLQDIETGLKRFDGGDEKMKIGQGHRADGETNWGEGSSSNGKGNRGDRGRGRGRGRGSGGDREKDKTDRGIGSGKGGGDVTCYCCGQKGHIKPNCPKKGETCRKCNMVGHLQKMCKSSGSGDGADKPKPEAGQFEDLPGYESCMCNLVDAEARRSNVGNQRVNNWLGDSGSSHHIVSSSVGMIDVTKCPAGMRIQQVQGIVDVKEWGTVLLRVDGADGKRIIQLKQTLIIPDIKVNLFSIQRLINKGYLPVYGEVDGKCIIKKKTGNGVWEQYATMTMTNGRGTLDCELIDGTLRSSGPALPIDSYKADLDVQLLHRRLGHTSQSVIQRLVSELILMLYTSILFATQHMHINKLL